MGIELGPPALEARTLPLGYRGGSLVSLFSHFFTIFFSIFVFFLSFIYLLDYRPKKQLQWYFFSDAAKTTLVHQGQTMQEFSKPCHQLL